MKAKQMNLKRMPRAICIGLTILLLLPVVSCRKNNSLQSQASSHNLLYTAGKLNGVLFSGKLFTQNDEEGMALLCNDGKILIALQKIQSDEITNPGNIEHAEIVYSEFGIIIRDADTNKQWYYIQNDENSKKQFESLEQAVERPVTSAIAGTIKINISQNS
ncbi:MAG TPA: hypothetical protein VKI61_03760 [Chitinophagaceae bacterium]|jgi:hypothetical protein|nr:hypothetical protein [Chitinophagaceae bacterium]